MTRFDPAWIQSLTYSAREDRQLLDVLFTVEGVVSGLAVTQRAAGANLSVDVAPGGAAIQGDSVTAQGKYVVKSDAIENVVIGAPPGSNSRIDLIVARVRDNTHDAGGFNDFVFESVAGVAAPAPVAPATPASAIVLAQVLVAAGDSAITNSEITDFRPFARMVGEAPVGTVEFTAAATAPDGYAIANGAAVSRTAPRYAALFAAIGTTHGAGNGSTTFNLPDLTDRAPIGTGANAVGAAVGAADAAVVSHSHTTPAHSHSHAHSAGVNSVDHSHTVAAHDHGGGTGVHSHGVVSQVGSSTGGHTHGAGAGQFAGPPSGSAFFTGDTATASATGQANSAQSPATGGISAQHSHSVGTDATTASPTTNSAGSSGTGANVPPSRALTPLVKL